MSDLARWRQVRPASPQLPVSWYFDPQIFALEKKLLFDAGANYVGHELMVPRPGDYHTLDWTQNAWMPPIQAWKSLSMIFIGSRLRGRVGEGLQHLALEHLDLLLRDFQLLLAEARQLEAAPVDGERFLKRQLAALHPRHDFFQLGERALEGGLA